MNAGKKIIATLLIGIYMIASLGMTTFAMQMNINDETNDDVQDISSTIYIDYTYNDTPLDDVEFKLYHIAETNEDGEYETLERFSHFEIDYDQLTDETYWIQVSNNLDNYISINNLEPDQGFISDGLGQYEANDLEEGYYIIQAKNKVDDTVVYFSSPVLILVGYFENDIDMWLYYFTVQPKISQVLAEELESVSVEKIWENVSSTSLIPEEIEVQLYCDGELYDTVTLNEENEWFYLWSDVDPTATWGIVELTEFDDYEVNYDRTLNSFAIYNTYVGEGLEELPQTGSFAHVIPVYAGIGVGLILLGALIGVKGKKDED